MAIGEIPVAILLAEKIVMLEARISSALRHLAVTAVAVAAQGRVLRAYEVWNVSYGKMGKMDAGNGESDDWLCPCTVHGNHLLGKLRSALHFSLAQFSARNNPRMLNSEGGDNR